MIEMFVVRLLLLLLAEFWRVFKFNNYFYGSSRLLFLTKLFTSVTSNNNYDFCFKCFFSSLLQMVLQFAVYYSYSRFSFFFICLFTLFRYFKTIFCFWMIISSLVLFLICLVFYNICLIFAFFWISLRHSFFAGF